MAQLSLFIRRIDMEFSVTEELAILMSMEWSTTSSDLHEEISELLQRLNI